MRSRITRLEIDNAFRKPGKRGRARKHSLAEVLEMRRLYVREDVPIRVIAEEFLTTIPTACAAIRGVGAYRDTLADR